MRTAGPELLPLFRSAGQARLLTAVFLAPLDQHFSIEELSRQARLSYATAHREVNRLISAGILAEERIGKLRSIRPNTASPYYDNLRSLLEQAFGPEPLLRAQLSALPGVEAAAIYGSFAARQLGEHGEAPRDIDVLVIGNPNLDDLYETCERISQGVKREVNPTVVSAVEWHDVSSSFLRNIRRHPLVPLLGDWTDSSGVQRRAEER